MRKNYLLLFLCLPILFFGQTTFTSSITPDLSAYGEATNYPGEGEYQIFLSPDNTLDKPIILVDDFDPGDTRTITGLYSALDFESGTGTSNLADLLRAEGYDIVILNFTNYTRTADGAEIDGGVDFMERNAMLLVELLDIINAAKADNEPEENVIIGAGMGGVISRYALNYMETNTLEADTRLNISFDAPHYGVNIPIGLQHQLNFLAYNDYETGDEIKPVIDGFFNSPAGKQLLIDHFNAHLLPGDLVNFDPALTLPQPDAFRTIFENNINSMGTNGFPSEVRNVTIANGSGIGSSYFAMGESGVLVSNGFTVMSTTLLVPTGFGDAIVDLDINFTPSAGTTANVSTVVIDPPIFVTITGVAESQSFENIDGVDSAPGGLLSLSGITDNIVTGNPAADDFIAALQIDKFSFVPTVSALALEITDDTPIDWHHDIDLAGRATTNNTPFDNTYVPDDNERHLELTPSNVNFAMMEIMNPPLGVTERGVSNFQIEKNPVIGNLVLLSNVSTEAKIEIVDVTGKSVYINQITLANRTSIPVDLTSGFYILNITAENESTFTTKFLAE